MRDQVDRRGRWCIALAMSMGVVACSGGSAQPEGTAFRPEETTTAPPTTGPLAVLEDPVLDWYPCRVEFECATFFVPTDYRNVDRDQTFLTLQRIPAADEDNRIGALLVNPGGPGGSGIDFVTYAFLAFPPEILDRFDIIGFDPRGVGESSKIDCITDPLMEELLAIDWADTADAAISEAIGVATTIGEACTAEHRVELAYQGTVNAARDMDMIRRALGEEQISYIGLSYGTKLGAVYATLYPDRVRAMVLDGALVSGEDPFTFAEVRAAAFEEAFASFGRACTADPTCPIDEDPVVVLRELLAAAAEEPMMPDDEELRPLTRPMITSAAASSLYDIGSWPLLAEALAAARAGDVDVLVTLADQTSGRSRYETFDESLDAFLAVDCADHPERMQVDDVAPELPRLASAAPLLGATQLGFALLCNGWPIGASPVPDLDGSKAPPALVVGTTRDPATPFVWAQALADDLGNGVAVRNDGDGHTSFPWGSCMSGLVVPYLVDLKVPAAGASCGAEQVIPPFGFGAEDLYEALILAGVPPDGAACLVDGLSGELDPADLIRLLIDDELTPEVRQILDDVAFRCVDELLG